MRKNKPRCSDFIIAALRTIRYNPANLKKGTKAGVVMRRLWKVASEAYSEKEFREALNRLIKDGTVVATWRVWHIRVNHKGENTEESRSSSKFEKVNSIPRGMPLTDSRVYRNMTGKFINNDIKIPVERDFIFFILLYVASDGLPDKVTKLNRMPAAATADRIIAKMSEKS